MRNQMHPKSICELYGALVLGPQLALAVRSLFLMHDTNGGSAVINYEIQELRSPLRGHRNKQCCPSKHT